MMFILAPSNLLAHLYTYYHVHCMSKNFLIQTLPLIFYLLFSFLFQVLYVLCVKTIGGGEVLPRVKMFHLTPLHLHIRTFIWPIFNHIIILLLLSKYFKLLFNIIFNIIIHSLILLFVSLSAF